MRSLSFLSGAMSSISMLKVSSWPRSNLLMQVKNKKTFKTCKLNADYMLLNCGHFTCLHSSAAASLLCPHWLQTQTCRSACPCLRSAHHPLPRSPRKSPGMDTFKYFSTFLLRLEQFQLIISLDTSEEPLERRASLCLCIHPCRGSNSAFRNSLVMFTHPLADGNGLRVQHIEDSGSQAVSSIFGQPALAGKDVFDPFGWHGNRQLIHQPAAVRSGPVMAKLRAGTGRLSNKFTCTHVRALLLLFPSHLDLFNLAHI